MNKFKIGDKIIVKENFWEIKSDIDATDNRKKLAGRTLEVKFVFNDGDVYTKQDDSNDNTNWSWDKNWVEPALRTIDDVQEDDLITNGGISRRVLGRTGKAVFTTYSWGKGEGEQTGSCGTFSIQELKGNNYTIVNETPTPEKLELTLEQVAEKFGVDVTNIKIKK